MLCELPIGYELKTAAIIELVPKNSDGEDVVSIFGFLIIVCIFDQIDLVAAVVCELLCCNCFSVDCHNKIDIRSTWRNCQLVMHSVFKFLWSLYIPIAPEMIEDLIELIFK